MTAITMVFTATICVADAPSFQGKRWPYTMFSRPFPAPIIPWHKDKGGVTNISRYQGKVILLNFWATWCPACLHELPVLDQLEHIINHPDFAVLTVNLDEPRHSVVEDYLRRLNVKNLPLLLDPLSRSIDAYEIREGLPWTFIIDRHGNMRGYMMGAAEWGKAKGVNLIRHYLDESAQVDKSIN